MTRPIAALAIAAGLAASAVAQTPSFTSDSTISMPLSWSEVNGNNNGLLEPGESAAIVMNLSITNQFGIAHFSPSIGTLRQRHHPGPGLGLHRPRRHGRHGRRFQPRPRARRAAE